MKIDNTNFSITTYYPFYHGIFCNAYVWLNINKKASLFYFSWQFSIRDYSSSKIEHKYIRYNNSWILMPTGGEVIREAGCWTKGPGFESRVRHGCHTVRPWPHQWLCSKTVRREMTISFLGRPCRPSLSKFSVVFFEIRVNMG